jgi:ABC-type multidrug transport system permease subunit
MGLIFGGVLFRIGTDQSGAHDRIGTLLLILVLMPYIALNSSLNIWARERLIFTRERKEGLYDLLPFYLSFIIVYGIYEIFFTIIFFCISYWMCNLNNHIDRFFIFIGIMCLVIFCTQSFGYFIISMINHYPTAFMASSFLFTIFLMSCGWVINLKDMPVWSSWVAKISYLKYGYEALSLNEFKGEHFYCTKEELNESNGICPITNGEQMIESLGMQNSSILECILFIAGLSLLLQILFYLMLKFKSQKPKI